MSDSYIVGIFTLAGAALGSWVTFAVAAKTARIEERKHFRELGLKVALTKFEGCMKLAQQLANETGKFQPVPPFEAFVINGVKLMEIVSTPGLSADEIARRMAKISDLTQAINHAAQEKK
jgi:hypothetical protein